MVYLFELVRSRRKDTLWSGLSQRCQRESAGDKGELEVSIDEAKELSR
jgi:hypothetical protein